jgi:hypothetical protein
MLPPTGEYSICRTELQENSDGLVFHTLSWGYDSEEEAAAAVCEIAEKNQVEITDIAIIKVTSAAELERKGLLPDALPPASCDSCGSKDVNFEIMPLQTESKDDGALVQFKICSACGARSQNQRIE